MATLLDFARTWLANHAPEPAKCIYCHAPHPNPMYTADLFCAANNYQSHVYQFAMNLDPDAHAKELAEFGRDLLRAGRFKPAGPSPEERKP